MGLVLVGREVSSVNHCQGLGWLTHLSRGHNSLNSHQATAVYLSSWEMSKKKPWLQMPWENAHLNEESDLRDNLNRCKTLLRWAGVSYTPVLGKSKAWLDAEATF